MDNPYHIRSSDKQAGRPGLGEFVMTPDQTKIGYSEMNLAGVCEAIRGLVEFIDGEIDNLIVQRETLRKMLLALVLRKGEM